MRMSHAVSVSPAARSTAVRRRFTVMGTAVVAAAFGAASVVTPPALGSAHLGVPAGLVAPATCDGKAVTIFAGSGITYGTAGDDVIRGTDSADEIWAGAGDDTICGLDGADDLHGQGGRDRIFGGRHSDVLYGGSGADHIEGRKGHDRIYGRTGDDRLEGGPGNDYLEGEEGEDRSYGQDGRDTIDLTEGDGLFDIGRGGRGDDYLYAYDSFPDHLEGRKGTDQCWYDTNLDTRTGCELIGPPPVP